jgi:hypothetical protein
MKQKNFLKLTLLVCMLFSVSESWGQIYNADFSNNGDGFSDHTSDSPPAGAPGSAGPFGTASNQWSLSYTSAPNTDGSANSFKVIGTALVSDDWGGQGIFESQSIDVSAINSVDISAITVNSGANDDTFKYFYILDGAARVETANIESTNGNNIDYTISGLDVSAANSLVVGFEFDENGGGDGYTTSSFTVITSLAATPGITLGTVSNNTNETGTTATFTVVLDEQPTADVVLNISSADTGEVTLDLATLTFTNANWDTPQTVTATGVDDALQDGTIIVTITVAVDDASSDDDYDAVVDATTTVTNEDDELPNLIINEFQADPDGTLGDANGDGSVDTGDDEFIEIYNASGAELNITNYTIEDGNSLRHTFPDGTILPAGAVIVVFGGGTPTGIPCLTQLASTGSLGLNNGGDSIIIKDASSTVVTTHPYASEGGDNQSVARDTDLTGAFVKHATIAGNAVLFSPGRKNADNIPFSKTWTGTTNNDWATTTNWDSNSNPSTSTDNVWIPAGLTNYPTSAAAVTVNSVTINSGATLKATNTFTANVTYNRTLTNGSQWYYMSSPVVGATYNDAWATANSVASGQNNNKGLSWYDNTSYDTNTGGSDTETGYWRYLQSDDSNSGSFNVGQGYGVFTSNSTTVSFIGTRINTSSQTRSITTDVSNFNLVGNPFTSFLNLGDFYADNPKTTVLAETEAYFWNGSSYDTKTSGLHPTYEIAPGQGFFIEAAADTNLTFDISDTNHLADTAESSDTFQKSPRSEIHLFLSDGTTSRYVNFYYIDGASTGFDSGYDGKLFEGVMQSFALYSHLVSDSEGKHFQLQSLPKDNYENMVIPVGVKAAANSEITFSANVLHLQEGLNVYLEDRLNNTFTRLDIENAVYKTTVSNAINENRFYLHTKAASALSISTEFLDTITIYKTDNYNLRINGLQKGSATISIFNVLGKSIMNTSFEASSVKNIALPNLASGVYIVKLQTEDGSLNKKIILE